MTGTTQVILTDAAYFESIYADASGDMSRIPWADGRASPALVNWLNAIAPSLIRCGSRVAVVGCGLGDDARELMKRGYDVTAFDCSATAIKWAKRLDPANEECYFDADLFNLSPRWKHRFDLVVENSTIQSMTPDLQAEAVAAIADLLSPRGHLLVICRGTDQPAELEYGPPWALTEAQLLAAATRARLVLDGTVASFMDDENPPIRRMRALFKRA